MRCSTGLRLRAGRLRPADCQGFVLALATLAGLVITLSSLTLLSSVLAGRQVQLAEMRRRQGDDSLQSAAQLMVDRLQSSHACLAPYPSSAWQPLPLACSQAEQQLDPAAVIQVNLGSETARLLDWQASNGDANLRIQLDPMPDGFSGRFSGVGRTGTFLLKLEPETARVLSLQRVGA